MDFFRQRYEHPKKQRYYILSLEPDLFGGVHLDRIWGGIGRSAQRKTEWFDDYEEALSRFQQEHDRRVNQRQYEWVENET